VQKLERAAKIILEEIKKEALIKCEMCRRMFDLSNGDYTPTTVVFGAQRTTTMREITRLCPNANGGWFTERGETTTVKILCQEHRQMVEIENTKEAEADRYFHSVIKNWEETYKCENGSHHSGQVFNDNTKDVDCERCGEQGIWHCRKCQKHWCRLHVENVELNSDSESEDDDEADDDE
jgi:hypothetical protein